ncbi:hypothetical protein T492DRAFT_69607 [Pavlovales sp. CCMP2436]|nr:hypothetical protein T492DRAFT_69607 [Pavlovales sp. CCMP2436]
MMIVVALFLKLFLLFYKTKMLTIRNDDNNHVFTELCGSLQDARAGVAPLQGHRHPLLQPGHQDARRAHPARVAARRGARTCAASPCDCTEPHPDDCGEEDGVRGDGLPGAGRFGGVGRGHRVCLQQGGVPSLGRRCAGAASNVGRRGHAYLAWLRHGAQETAVAAECAQGARKRGGGRGQRARSLGPLHRPDQRAPRADARVHGGVCVCVSVCVCVCNGIMMIMMMIKCRISHSNSIMTNHRASAQ